MSPPSLLEAARQGRQDRRREKQAILDAAG